MLEQFAEPSTANLRQILGQIDERRPGGERVARLVVSSILRICQKSPPPPHFFYFLGRLNELIKDIGLMTLVMRVSWNSKRDLVSLDKINDFHTFLTLFPDQGFVFINELSLNWSDKGRAGFPPENNRPL